MFPIKRSNLFFICVVFWIFSLLIMGCDLIGPTAPQPVQISIIYAPESERYMKKAMNDFNTAYANGTNPSTGKALAAGEQPIIVTGESGPSGQIMQGIVNAFIAPNNSNVKKPTIFMPAVSHWLSLANLQIGRNVFDVTNSPGTTNDPVVIAIWESRLKAIQAAYPGQEIGWKELIEVMNNPEGWAVYGFTGRTTIYYGHTDPYVSSSGLSTLISEFYACARYKNGFQDTRLTQEQVDNKTVQQCVRDLHSHIRHYSINTTDFKKYIACGGPDYLDFVALPEDEFLQITQGTPEVNGCKPTERLIALYPKEGTFFHEHPFAIVNADWVTPEQHQAAELFKQFVISGAEQQYVLPGGFRPANSQVPLGFPIVPMLGVDPTQPRTVLGVPQPQVIEAVQRTWSYVKKQADIWIVLDISGSMNDADKIVKAREAALAFLEKVALQDRVGLVVFNNDVNILVPLDSLERNKAILKQKISDLSASGGTALFDALNQTIQLANSQPNKERIQAIILWTDGCDTNSQTATQSSVLDAILASRASTNPLVVIPVAYGSDACIAPLNAIARSAGTNLQSGDQDTIRKILDLISSFF